MSSGNLSNEEIDSLLDGLDEDAPVAVDDSKEDSEGAQVSMDLNDLEDIGLNADNNSSSDSNPLADIGSDLDDGGGGASPSSDASSLDLSDLSGFGLEDSSSGADANVKKVNLGNLSLEDNNGTSSNIDMLLDVPMNITVELGRTVRKVSEILSLNVGAVVELNKLSGEPVELLVNGKVIALAEVVVIDENFGVRITEIIDPKDRVKFE